MIRNFVAAAAVAAAMAPVSSKATMVSFDFDTATFAVSGEATLSDSVNAVGGYDIETLSGVVSGPDGGPIAGLITNPNQPYAYDQGAWIFDNVAWSASPYLDNSGLFFSAGSYDYNLYTIGSTYFLSTNNPYGIYNPGEVVLAGNDPPAVPEPYTWAMMLVGFAGLGFAGYRTSRKATSIAD
jgi:hypothetical protein